MMRAVSKVVAIASIAVVAVAALPLGAAMAPMQQPRGNGAAVYRSMPQNRVSEDRSAGARPYVSTRAANDGITFTTEDKSTVTIGPDGLGVQVDRAGDTHPVAVRRPDSRVRPAIWDQDASDRSAMQHFARRNQRLYAPDRVIVVFRDGFNAGTLQNSVQSHQKMTMQLIGDAKLAAALQRARVSGMRMLLPSTASMRINAQPSKVQQAYVLQIASDPLETAQRLRQTPSVVYAEPDFYVRSVMPDSYRIPSSVQRQQLSIESRSISTRSFGASQALTQIQLPLNAGIRNSLQSFLNGNGIDAMGAYAALQQHGQLPGEGEVITNVSVGDLTDQSMADAGDFYVEEFGPTTIVQGGQRYLDLPGMPLIPTFVSDETGNLDPLGATEFEDATNGEIDLDFSVMAPLPSDRQRPGRSSSLLGIAPGAAYRLVVPQNPTNAGIDAALVAAAQQIPHPNVITASLGYGTDAVGFPGRYLEDDPLAREIVGAIVASGIVVCISSNDGTRLYTNEAIGPDGGSTPTDLPQSNESPTSLVDDEYSTTPSIVPDSGAIAAGGSTTDDISIAQPQKNSTLSHTTAFAETRISGGMNFSSGFGSRVNLSAPADNIPAYEHYCAFGAPCAANSVADVLAGGTSASAPEIAAAAAVVQQAARLHGVFLTPNQVRTILESTARPLPSIPQIDRSLHVGPQLDLSAAVGSALGHSSKGIATASVLRVAIAQRQELGLDGGVFLEETDPNNIDLQGPYPNGATSGLGQNAVSPITISPDWYNVPDDAEYRLSVLSPAKTSRTLATTPWARLTPAEILTAAGQTLISPTTRTVTLTYQATRGGHPLTSTTFSLTFGPTTGTYTEALAPSATATVKQGQSVTVAYDLTGVRNVQNPRLFVSSVGHWSVNAPILNYGFTLPLAQTKGTVTIPASAFNGGGGLYGVGIIQGQQHYGVSLVDIVGQVAPIRVAGSSDIRPLAPTLTVAPESGPAHWAGVARANPNFIVHYDVTNVPNATGAMLEISAPGPSLSGVLNVFTNAFGTQRDQNGFDSPSTVYRSVSGTRGDVSLSALNLGLPESMFYTVRVLPTNGLAVVGQASPVDGLSFDDGIAPGGFLTGFSINPGAVSAVTTAIADTQGHLLDTSVGPYDPASGMYGTPFVDNGSGATAFFGLGSVNGQYSVIANPPDVSMSPNAIYTFNLSTGQAAKSASLALNDYPQHVGLDVLHNRLALLNTQYNDGSTNLTRVLQTYDTTQYALGEPIDIGGGFLGIDGAFNMGVDQSLGKAFVTGTNAGPGCASPVDRSNIQSVDLASGAVSTAATVGAHCISNVLSDQGGGALYLGDNLPGSELIGGGLGSSTYSKIDESNLQLATVNGLSKDSGVLSVAYDRVHHVILLMCFVPSDISTNNSALSVVDEYDTTSGLLLKRIPAFNFTTLALGSVPFPENIIQLDPSTRTAYTFGPSVNELMQFKY